MTHLRLLPDDERDETSPEAVQALAFTKKLEGPHATGVYRELAQRWTRRGKHPAYLTPTEFHLLNTLLGYSAQLRNVFPKRSTLAKQLGTSRQALGAHLRSLTRKGWLRRHPLTQRDGTYMSAGCQFLIPSDILGPGHVGWEGPVDFQQHNQVQK